MNATEVRRCANCKQPTLVCVHDWRHVVLGIPTPSRTLDLQCTSCGVKVTLHPQTKIKTERFFAFLMIPAIFPSLYFFASARRKARAWTDNPIVTGAHHTPGTPRARLCDCGGAAACVAIRQNRMQSIPIGTRHVYRCAACAESFTVSDVTGIVFSLVAGFGLAGFGALILAFPPGSAVGAERSNAWFGVGLLACAALAWAMAALQVRARVIHPLVD